MGWNGFGWWGMSWRSHPTSLCGMPQKSVFYCKTCPEHIVSQRDLKDLSNQSQIMVHVRVSIPTPQELATGPRLLIAHIPRV
ncbi:uncharacterized [Tachysurus ichikawai]